MKRLIVFLIVLTAVLLFADARRNHVNRANKNRGNNFRNTYNGRRRPGVQRRFEIRNRLNLLKTTGEAVDQPDVLPNQEIQNAPAEENAAPGEGENKETPNAPAEENAAPVEGENKETPNAPAEENAVPVDGENKETPNAPAEENAAPVDGENKETPNAPAEVNAVQPVDGDKAAAIVADNKAVQPVDGDAAAAIVADNKETPGAVAEVNVPVVAENKEAPNAPEAENVPVVAENKEAPNAPEAENGLPCREYKAEGPCTTQGCGCAWSANDPAKGGPHCWPALIPELKDGDGQCENNCQCPGGTCVENRCRKTKPQT